MNSELKSAIEAVHSQDPVAFHGCLQGRAERLLVDEVERLQNILAAVDYTLTAHGHMDADTQLHARITEALK